MIAWRECWLSLPVACDHGIVHLDCWSFKIFSLLLVLSTLIFILWGFWNWVLLSILAILCRPRDSMMRMLIVYTCIMWSHDQRWDIVHLDCWSIKIFSLLGVLSALIFILWLLSYCAFVSFSLFSVCPRDQHDVKCWMSTPVSCDHDQRWDIVHLDCFNVLKYFHIMSCFVSLDFYQVWAVVLWSLLIHFGFSLSAHVTEWQECWLSTPVSCDHMTRDISYTLIVGVLKYFHLFWVLSALIFILCGFCPMVLLSILAFLCPPTWSHDENVDCPHLYHVITWPEMGFDRTPWLLWSIKIFSLLGVLSALIFILWGFCPMVLLSILAFLCPPTWSHDENVDCPHLYHVITWTEMGSYTLIVGVLKYFLFLWFCHDLMQLSFGSWQHSARGWGK